VQQRGIQAPKVDTRKIDEVMACVRHPETERKYTKWLFDNTKNK
jgi:hypothetical protein